MHLNNKFANFIFSNVIFFSNNVCELVKTYIPNPRLHSNRKDLLLLSKNLNLTCSRAQYQMSAFLKKNDVQSVDIVNDWFEI